MKEPASHPSPTPAARFATTRWSLVVSAGRDENDSARQALADLCQAYWYPLYALIRRRGHQASDACDLTQEFFAFLLEHGTLRAADPARGRFRTFLLAVLDNFLANQHRRQAAARRGGGVWHVPIDGTISESRFLAEPAHQLTPERLFDRRWALDLLDRATARLRADYADNDQSELFDRLQPCLGGSAESLRYADLAAQLQTTPGAVKTAVHRIRRRFRERLREEVAQTVCDLSEVDDELRALIRAVERSD